MEVVKREVLDQVSDTYQHCVSCGDSRTQVPSPNPDPPTLRPSETSQSAAEQDMSPTHAAQQHQQPP